VCEHERAAGVGAITQERPPRSLLLWLP